MQPNEVPEELVDMLATVLDDDAHEGCDDGTCPGNVRPYFEDVSRHALAEVLPECEREIRAKLAAEIEALVVIVPIGQTPVEAKAEAYRSAARIARGEA